MAEDYLSFLDRMAREYGIPPAEARAIYQLESSSGVNARRSPAGAIGHMQLMPGTARELGVNPHDPYENIRGGVRYYAQQRKRFGDPGLAAAAYNAGPGRVSQAGNRVPQIAATRKYVTNFLQQIGRVRPAQPRAALSEDAGPVSAGRLTADQWAANVEAMGRDRAEAWRIKNNFEVEGMPPLQGQRTMDEDEEDVGGALPGTMGSLSSAPTTAEWGDWMRRSQEQQQQFAAMRRQQFEQGQKLIQQMYGGPSTSDRLWALSQALLSPKPYRGFAGTAYNISRALGGVQQEARAAEKQRAEALVRLQQSYQTGEMQGAESALERELKVLEARAKAGKPGAAKSVIIENGVAYDPGSGETIAQPAPSAWDALRANPTAENYQRFVSTFGERFAEKAQRIVLAANPSLRGQ